HPPRSPLFPYTTLFGSCHRRRGQGHGALPALENDASPAASELTRFDVSPAFRRPSLRVVIRADAGPQIGAGHLMRCLALAQALQDRGGRARFVMSVSAE